MKYLIFFTLHSFYLLGLNFSELSNETFTQQKIQIRGFLYCNNANRWFLSEQANLKSCCVGSSHTINQQICIVAEFPKSFHHTAQTLEGTLVVKKQFNEKGEVSQMFFLQNPQVIESGIKTSTYFIITVCAILALVSLRVYSKWMKNRMH